MSKKGSKNEKKTKADNREPAKPVFLCPCGHCNHKALEKRVQTYGSIQRVSK